MTQPRVRPSLGQALAAHYADQNAAAVLRREEDNEAGIERRNDYWRNLARRIVTVPHGDKIYFSLTADQREMVDAFVDTGDDAA